MSQSHAVAPPHPLTRMCTHNSFAPDPTSPPAEEMRPPGPPSIFGVQSQMLWGGMLCGWVGPWGCGVSRRCMSTHRWHLKPGKGNQPHPALFHPVASLGKCFCITHSPDNLAQVKTNHVCIRYSASDPLNTYRLCFSEHGYLDWEIFSTSCLQNHLSLSIFLWE